MKKLFVLLFGFGLAVFTFTSCSLASCKCVTHSTDGSADITATLPSLAGACNLLNTSVSDGTSTVTMTCVEQ